MQPPRITCLTLTVHPGIAEDGEVEMCPLVTDWSPYKQVTDVLVYLRGLMNTPGEYVVD